ncbi:hypothetical protein KW805_00830 [Candidatus Pacearchaeota archaeon]|nr:hypothetical protein [Candidatus Pacearchaeota archaeon]
MTLLDTETESQVEFVPRNEPRTLPLPSRTDPRRKEVGTEEFHARIIVVSPYNSLNTYLSDKIPTLIPKSYVDIVSSADLDTEPYINVALKEKGFPQPLWIVDCEKIKAPVLSYRKAIPSRIEEFKEALRSYANNISSDKLDNSSYAFFSHPEMDRKKIEKIAQYHGSTLEKWLITNLPEFMEKAENPKTVAGVVRFHEYGRWAKGKDIVYLSPRYDFSGFLQDNHKYDEGGNFDPNHPDVRHYRSGISADLESIAQRRFSDSMCVFNVNNYPSSQD